MVLQREGINGITTTPPLTWDIISSQVIPKHFVSLSHNLADLSVLLQSGERHSESRVSCVRTITQALDPESRDLQSGALLPNGLLP